MHYTYKTGGTCSTMIDFDIIDGKLHNIMQTAAASFISPPARALRASRIIIAAPSTRAGGANAAHIISGRMCCGSLCLNGFGRSMRISAVM